MEYLFNQMVEKGAKRVLKYYSILEDKQERRWNSEVEDAKVKELGNINKRRKRRQNEKKFMDTDWTDVSLFGDKIFICR